MNVQKSLKNRIRGWLPQEHTVYAIKRTAVAHRWLALPIGFVLFIVAATVIRAITGSPVQGFDSLLIFASGYTVGFIIGVPASKKVQERYTAGALGAPETGRLFE